MPLDVVVLGSIDEDIGDLSSEVQRSKAALLYGDTITLASHKLPLLLARIAARTRLISRAMLETGVHGDQLAAGVADAFEELAASGPQDQLAASNRETILNLLRGENPASVFQLPEYIAEQIRTDGRSRDPKDWFEIVAPVAVQNYLRQNQSSNESQARRAILELVALSQQSLVQLEGIDVQDLDSTPHEELKSTYERTIERAVDALANAASTQHPLFTKGVRLALRDRQQTLGLPGVDFTKANRVELAARLVESVPTFPDATVDELVDLRRRVGPHLARFRAAVADFEAELNADVLDEQFDHAVDDIKLRRVDPALEELRESLHDTGALRTLTRAVPTMAASTLALGASMATGAAELLGVAAVAAGASTALAKEVLERHRQADERRRHRLFLLFDTERQSR